MPVDDTRVQGFQELPIRHPRRWGDLGVSLVVGVLAVGFVVLVARSGVIAFGDIPHFMVDPPILKGLVNTYIMMAGALVLGLAVGLVVALLRLSRNRVAKVVSGGFLWVFMGTPGIVQLIFWYNLGIVIPRLTIELPGLGVLWTGRTNDLMTPFVAAVVGLGLHEGAYFAEIIRSGISAIDPGQRAAAQSLGIRRRTVMTRIILPQAVRVMIPPGWGRLIALMKDTSLVTVIAGGELMTAVVSIYSRNFKILELLIVACIWYLITYSVLMFAQHYVERWANRYHVPLSKKRRKAIGAQP